MGSVQLSSVLHSVKKYTIIFAFTVNERKTEKLKTVALVQYTLGAFQSTTTSGLKFRQLLVANGTIFSKISKKKRTTSRSIPKFSKIFSESFLSTQLCPRNFYNFRLNGSHFGNSTVFGFSGNFSPFAAISKFSEVSVEWKAPFTLGSGSRM